MYNSMKFFFFVLVYHGYFRFRKGIYIHNFISIGRQLPSYNNKEIL